MGRKLGRGLHPLCAEGVGSPSNTESPGLRPTFVPSGILIHPGFGHNKHGPKIWGAPPPFWGGELGLHLTQSHLG